MKSGFGNLLFTIFFILGCYIFFIRSSHSAPIIVYQDHPILNDQTITVDTYYDDVCFDGYHTIVYSSSQPQLLFMHEVNTNSIDIVHAWAKCWITQKVNEHMISQCCESARRAKDLGNLDLYTIYEEKE